MNKRKKLIEHFEKTWEVYTELNLEATKIAKLLKVQNPILENDHIALRTFCGSKTGLSQSCQYYLKMGYHIGGHYKFHHKKLNAVHLENSFGLPLIFISELELNSFSSFFQDIFRNIVIPENISHTHDGRTWDASYKTYQKLLNESDYGAWLYAWGFVPNHFTISVNQLVQFSELAQVNSLLRESGYSLNESGGTIKGTPADFLEQSSTLAYKTKCQFIEGSFEIPSCYYEFAKRYNDKSGTLFQGFSTQSADKIFESTNS
jgi:hypothetical protein